jgi:methylenetetrahydrofolate reductase (NADPH)
MWFRTSSAADFLGIHNVLVVRGDANQLTGRFIAAKNGHEHALDLLRQVVDLNHGKYLEDDLENPESLDFSPGVAAYPEKHLEAPNFESDLFYLKAKADAGAEYIVTQMFFDNSKFFSFVEACRAAGITVPIIPGIKPVSIKKHQNLLPQTFKVDIPMELTREMDKCTSNDQVRQVGIEWAIQQSRELIAYGVPIIHFFTMGRGDNIRKIAEGIL